MTHVRPQRPARPARATRPLAAAAPTPIESRVLDTDVRWDLVNRVRAEILAGDYDTPERWDAALDRLADAMLAD